MNALSKRAALALVAACIAAPAWTQDGSLRERLRERWQQRHPQADATTAVTPDTRITAAGDYSFTLDHDGLRRAYRVHVPRVYDPARPTPLLVALHGGGGNMDFEADDRHYGLISASERDGFIAVFPNGYSTFPGGRLATWNAGACCGAARDRHVDDVGFVRAMIDRLERQLDIDAGRIYATGMSNGGMLAQRLACEMADVFKAVVPVAGTDNTLACSPSRPISVLEIHARDDDHVLFGGGAGPGAFRDESKVTVFSSVPETMSRWVRRNGCAATPRRVLDKPGAYCERYDGCREGTQVELCVTETGGHSWPGSSLARAGKQAASTAIDVDSLMWEFFGQLPR